MYMHIAPRAMHFSAFIVQKIFFCAQCVYSSMAKVPFIHVHVQSTCTCIYMYLLGSVAQWGTGRLLQDFWQYVEL